MLRLRSRRRGRLLVILWLHNMVLRDRDLTLMHLLKLERVDRWSTECRTLWQSRGIWQTYSSCSNWLGERRSVGRR